AGVGRIRAGGADTRRVASVEDLVRFASVGDARSTDWRTGYNAHEHLAAFSPDRERVAVVVTRGNPQTGANEGELLVYRTKDLLQRPLPTVVATFASLTNYRPISYVRWLADNATLVFSATDGERATEVYRASAEGGHVTQLTSGSEAVVWYDI